MSDVFSFNDGEKNITLRYYLSSPLASSGQNNQELPSVYKRYAIQMYLEMKKLEMLEVENLLKQIVI